LQKDPQNKELLEQLQKVENKLKYVAEVEKKKATEKREIIEEIKEQSKELQKEFEKKRNNNGFTFIQHTKAI